MFSNDVVADATLYVKLAEVRYEGHPIVGKRERTQKDETDCSECVGIGEACVPRPR